MRETCAIAATAAFLLSQPVHAAVVDLHALPQGFCCDTTLLSIGDTGQFLGISQSIPIGSGNSFTLANWSFVLPIGAEMIVSIGSVSGNLINADSTIISLSGAGNLILTTPQPAAQIHFGIVETDPSFLPPNFQNHVLELRVSMSEPFSGASPFSGSYEVVTHVPEPSVWAMLTLGFVGAGLMAYRQRNRRQRSLNVFSLRNS
jgi:PEP-CTERM motif